MMIFWGIFYDSSTIADYMTSNGRTIDKLERIEKEAVVA
jgi:hypothetical protein